MQELPTVFYGLLKFVLPYTLSTPIWKLEGKTAGGLINYVNLQDLGSHATTMISKAFPIAEVIAAEHFTYTFQVPTYAVLKVAAFTVKVVFV